MPSQPSSPTPKRRTCRALTTQGQPCKRPAVAGLHVCKSHGGATAASVQTSRRAQVQDRAAALWGISEDTGSDFSVEGELRRLARNKLTDIIALRIKISEDGHERHIGRLVDSVVDVEYDIIGTVQSKEGSQSTRTKKAGVSVWVQELHKAEGEFLGILRLLHEVAGSTEEVDLKRLRLQTGRQAAKLAKAFPGMSADNIAAEVSKSA